MVDQLADSIKPVGELKVSSIQFSPVLITHTHLIIPLLPDIC